MTLLTRLTSFTATTEARFPALGRVVEGVHLLEDGPLGGPTGCPPIVLVHGASGNLRDWTLSIQPALARDHRVIALDRPGFGYSPPLAGHGWRLDDQIAALRRALQALGHAEYVLAGHSYGGSLVLRWALNHPAEVKGVLALAAPAMDWGGSGIGAHYRIGGRAVIGDVLAQAAGVLAGPGYVASAVAEVFAPNPIAPGYLKSAGAELALRPRTFRANAAMMLKLYPQVAAQCRRYGEITCPLEIVHGAADTIVPASVHAQPLAARVPQARLTLLPGIGHMPHHAAADPVIEAIARLMQAAENSYANHEGRRDPPEDPVHRSRRRDRLVSGNLDGP